LAVDDPLLADRLVEGHRAALALDSSADGPLGEIALRTGRYREAVERLRRAGRRRPHDLGIQRAMERATGELALLDPAWRPVLPPRYGPVEARAGRILHLLTNSLPYRSAGYTVRAQQVARCQQAMGLDPVMVTRAGFPGNEGAVGAPPASAVDGIVYRRLDPGLEPGIPIDAIAQRTAAALAALAGELRPAVLQPTTNHVNAQVALAVGEQLDIPVVYEVRGFLEETWRARIGDAALRGDRYAGARAVETDCMRRAAAIVTLSETMRTEILSRGGIDPSAVVVVPNAVDADRFHPGPRDEGLAASLGIAPSETVVGYISSLIGYEGIETLIEAVAMLRCRSRPVRLLIVGDGEARGELEAAAARAGLLRGGRAVFTGRVAHADIERYYRTIDIFVVPRTRDRVSQLVTPLKPYEAMAMAKALIVSAVPALLEIVQDGTTGRTFPPEDSAALADQLDALIDNPAERRRLGEAARAWVLAERTWAQNGHRYLDLYRRLGAA
jgi:glycosyltransferase involved in cell wall biosynthesis